MVLDSKHGIEIINYGLSGKAFLPWYTKELASSRHGHVSRYYTKVDGFKRVEYSTWEAAYNHIARSRGLPTSKQEGSTYVQEAEAAGISVDLRRSQDPSTPTAEIIPPSILTLAQVEQAYKAGNLSDMDVFHLLNGNPTTGEE